MEHRVWLPGFFEKRTWKPFSRDKSGFYSKCLTLLIQHNSLHFSVVATEKWVWSLLKGSQVFDTLSSSSLKQSLGLRWKYPETIDECHLLFSRSLRTCHPEDKCSFWMNSFCCITVQLVVQPGRLKTWQSSAQSLVPASRVLRVEGKGRFRHHYWNLKWISSFVTNVLCTYIGTFTSNFSHTGGLLFRQNTKFNRFHFKS